MGRVDICSLFKERKTLELTSRQKIIVDFWEVAINTDFDEPMKVFGIADIVDEILNSPEVS
jgi:hypothetical protein